MGGEDGEGEEVGEEGEERTEVGGEEGEEVEEVGGSGWGRQLSSEGGASLPRFSTLPSFPSALLQPHPSVRSSMPSSHHRIHSPVLPLPPSPIPPLCPFLPLRSSFVRHLHCPSPLFTCRRHAGSCTSSRPWSRRHPVTTRPRMMGWVSQGHQRRHRWRRPDRLRLLPTHLQCCDSSPSRYPTP